MEIKKIICKSGREYIKILYNTIQGKERHNKINKPTKRYD